MAYQLPISLDELDSLEDKLIPYAIGKFPEVKETIETDVLCPICNTPIVLSLLRNSYEFSCKTGNCVHITSRGI